MAITYEDHPRTVRLGFRVAICETQDDIDWVRANYPDAKETGHPMHFMLPNPPTASNLPVP